MSPWIMEDESDSDEQPINSHYDREMALTGIRRTHNVPVRGTNGYTRRDRYPATLDYDARQRRFPQPLLPSPSSASYDEDTDAVENTDYSPSLAVRTPSPGPYRFHRSRRSLTPSPPPRRVPPPSPRSPSESSDDTDEADSYINRHYPFTNRNAMNGRIIDVEDLEDLLGRRLLAQLTASTGFRAEAIAAAIQWSEVVRSAMEDLAAFGSDGLDNAAEALETELMVREERAAGYDESDDEEWSDDY